MVHGYPGSNVFGPRHLEGSDEPPSLMFSVRPGTPEEEEEMELVRQWETGQEPPGGVKPAEAPQKTDVAYSPEGSDDQSSPLVKKRHDGEWLVRGDGQAMQDGSSGALWQGARPAEELRGTGSDSPWAVVHPIADIDKLHGREPDARARGTRRSRTVKSVIDKTSMIPLAQTTPAQNQGQPVASAARQGQRENTVKTPGAWQHETEQHQKDSANIVPTTTLRIGDYPAFKEGGYAKEELDEWNKKFRNMYGGLAVEAAKKAGVPARLLAALSANEMAAPNWTALNAWADRNTQSTKSVGPLQISANTALRYGLAPIDNEFFGIKREDMWSILHDPDVRHGRPSQPSGMTPKQRPDRRDNPYPNNPNGLKGLHDYLDNPKTGFEAGAKLLKIYLGRLVEDYKSGAYLKYSKDFRDLTELSRENSGIRRDLDILASGDKEAIFNLQFSAGLGRAIAMMWNNGRIS